MTEKTQLGMSQFTMIMPSYSIETETEPSPSREPMNDFSIQIEMGGSGMEWDKEVLRCRYSTINQEMHAKNSQKASWIFGKITP